MIGIWLIEIVCAFFFLLYSHKIVRLFYPVADGWFLVPFFFIITSAISFCVGDTTEELCLPICAFVAYNALKCIVKKDLPTNQCSLVIGLCAAFVFWMKFTTCAIFIGWFIVICIIAFKQKNIKDLFRISLFIVLGLIVLTIPILAFYAYHKALDDLFRVYFGYNLFNYAGNHGLATTKTDLFSALFQIFYPLNANFYIILTFYFSFVTILKNKDNFITLSFVLLSFPSIVVGIFLSANFPQYYLPIVVFLPLGFYSITEFVSQKCNHYITKNTEYLIMSLLFLISINKGLKEIFVVRTDTPQYHFAKIVNKKEGATLLEYRYKDFNNLHTHPIRHGFYTASGIVPNCYYFALIAAFPQEIQIAYQDSMVNEGAFDFLVATKGDYDLEFYSPIDSLDGYYLYKKTEKFY